MVGPTELLLVGGSVVLLFFSGRLPLLFGMIRARLEERAMRTVQREVDRVLEREKPPPPAPPDRREP